MTSYSITKAIETLKKKGYKKEIVLDDVYDVCLEFGIPISEIDEVLITLTNNGFIVKDVPVEILNRQKKLPPKNENESKNKNEVLISLKRINPNSSPEQSAIHNLLILYGRKGFVTEDDILDECDKAELPFSRIDYVGNQILANGVLISDGILEKKEPESIDEEVDFLDDLPDDFASDIDLARKRKVYEFFLELYPEMEGIIRASAHSTPLKERDIKRLLPQVRSGNSKAKEILVVSLVFEALYFSLYYRGETTIPLNEIYSEAMVGIIEVINSYDQYSDNSFYKSAKYYMKKRIERYIYDNEYMIHRGSYLSERIRAKQILSNHQYNYQYDKNISDESIINAINEYCTTDKARRYMDISDYISLEKMLEDECEVIPFDPDYHCLNLADRTEKEELKIIFQKIIETLQPREQLVIKLRYGIDDDQPRTLEEVGTFLSVSRERVRQIEAKTFRKIRHPSRIRYLQGYYVNNKSKQ